MVQLLIKDIRIQRRFIILGSIFVGFFFFALGAFEGMPLAVPAAFLSHFLIVVASKADEKNNNGRLLASFPLRRRDIVSAKYVGILMFIFIAFLLTTCWRLLGGFVLSAGELPWYSIQSTLLAILILIFFYSIYFPLFFALGSRIVQVLDLIVIFMVGGAFLIVIRILDLLNVNVRAYVERILAAQDILIFGWTIGGSVILVVISWYISIKVYEMKNI